MPDLAFKQDDHYSYFNTARGVYNLIDLTLFTDYDTINVKSCNITPPDTDNVSDHRPLRLPMELHVPLAEAAVTIDQSKQVNVTYWIRQINNKRYNKGFDVVLRELAMHTLCPELSSI